MATNPNKELFRRTAPEKKIEIVNKLTTNELLSITPDTIIRMVKEAGSRKWKSRNRELYIRRDFWASNGWNSCIESFDLYNGKIYLDAYIQLDHTDTNKSVPYADFFGSGEYRGSLIRSDQYGNPETHYFIYNCYDKAEVLKSICLEYIYTKYKDKLNKNQNGNDN